MKFVDIAKIYVKSGHGGAGCVSMRREKYIRFGGPDGGDGGKGGNILIKGDSRLTTLLDLRIHPHQKAGNGLPGMGDQKTGKSGTDKIICVPLGTTIIEEKTEEILFDIIDKTDHLLLTGGRGGQGNMHFKSSRNQTPRFAQPGEPGEDKWIRLELKIMADVGLVGLPNAGKSTLISAISNAKPKIAAYPFTTLVPNLGVVRISDYSSYVVADIPGIIENAHRGTGLGDKFLKHIQRTAVLAFLIDCAEDNKRSPTATFYLLLNELEQFSPSLTQKDRIILLTKMDSLNPKLNIEKIIDDFNKGGEEEVFPISSVTRKGLDKVKYRLLTMVEEKRSGSSKVN